MRPHHLVGSFFRQKVEGVGRKVPYSKPSYSRLTCNRHPLSSIWYPIRCPSSVSNLKPYQVHLVIKEQSATAACKKS
jgi:hypothetical protein